MEKNNKGILITIVALIAVVFIILAISPSQTSKDNQQNTNVKEVSESIKITPEVTSEKDIKMESAAIDTTKTYTATLNTSAGDIKIELFASKVPNTVNNFVTLINKGFYNNVIFHRTIKDFMIQGGDPTGTGMGGPGYKFNDEPFEGEYTRGTVAMANSGPNTNGSQFFIMHNDVPLQKNYVIFGKVIEGMDTVDKIATAPVKISPSGEQSSPVDPVKIQTASVEVK